MHTVYIVCTVHAVYTVQYTVHTIETALHCLNSSTYAYIYIVVRLERCWIYALWASEDKVRVEWSRLGDTPQTVVTTRAPGVLRIP